MTRYTTPPPIPRPSGNKGPHNKHFTVLVIGCAIIAASFFIGAAMFYRTSRDTAEFREFLAMHEWADQKAKEAVREPAEGEEHQSREDNPKIGDNYTFRIPEDSFAPVPAGAKGVKPFICRIDNIVPDKYGKVSIGAENARTRFNIDSLIATADNEFQPLVLKVKGHPNTLVTVTYVDTDIYNHTDPKKGDYHSYIAMIQGYIYTIADN